MSYSIKPVSFSILCAVIVLVAPDDLRAKEKAREFVASTYNYGLSILIVNNSEAFVAGTNSFL
jgi:hypothetical protein